MKKKTKNRLSEKAMLVHLRISMWTGRQKDSKISNTVCSKYNAEKDTGAWWTYLIPKQELDAVNKTRSQCRSIWIKYTLPWLDGGIRVLPSAMFMKYTKRMRKAITKYEESVEVFLSRYPEMIELAEKRLGHLLVGKTLPSVSEVKSKFAIKQDILPMPSADDFRIDLEDDEANEIREQIKTSIEGMVDKAMEDLWEQMMDMIGKIEKTMKKPEKIFRDSIISNLAEFVEMLPKLNLTEDSKLEDFRKEAMKKLTKLKPDNLRNNKRDRRKASKEAKDLFNKMKEYRK